MSSSRRSKSNPRSRSRQAPLSRSFQPAKSRGLARFGVASGVIGGAFAMGLLFGDHATSDGASALDGGLAQIDALSQQYDRVRERVQLTFHQELTAAEKAVEASRVRRAEFDGQVKKALPILAHVDNPLQRVQKNKLLAVPAPEAVTPVKTQGHAEAPHSATSPSTFVAPGAQKSTAALKDASSSGALPAVVEPAVVEPAVVRGNRKRLAAALSSLFGDDAPSLTKPAPKAAVARHVAKSTPSVVAEAFYVQVASSPDAEAADRLRGQLLKHGHAAAVVQAQVGERLMHRVVINGFGSRADATAAKLQVKSSIGLDGLVRTARR